jgi:hypothetical protein
MRTTVTLDPDVEQALKARMREKGLSFKEALNAAVRSGLSPGRGRSRKFVQKTYSMGKEQYFRWDKALAMADALEDEEIIRKMSLQK